MQAEPEFYQEQAKRTRDIAARVKEQNIKANLLDVAARYDELAVSAKQEPD